MAESVWTWRTIPWELQTPLRDTSFAGRQPVYVMVEAEELGPRVTGHMDAQCWRDAGRMAKLLRFYLDSEHWRGWHGTVT
jgi:hypothetical protein